MITSQTATGIIQIGLGLGLIAAIVLVICYWDQIEEALLGKVRRRQVPKARQQKRLPPWFWRGIGGM